MAHEPGKLKVARSHHAESWCGRWTSKVAKVPRASPHGFQITPRRCYGLLQSGPGDLKPFAKLLQLVACWFACPRRVHSVATALRCPAIIVIDRMLFEFTLVTLQVPPRWRPKVRAGCWRRRCARSYSMIPSRRPRPHFDKRSIDTDL